MSNFVVNNITPITMSPKFINGDIEDWKYILNQAHRYHTKMRVVATEDGGVKMEFYSPWDIGEPTPPVIEAKRAVKKSWWSKLFGGKF